MFFAVLDSKNLKELPCRIDHKLDLTKVEFHISNLLILINQVLELEAMLMNLEIEVLRECQQLDILIP